MHTAAAQCHATTHAQVYTNRHRRERLDTVDRWRGIADRHAVWERAAWPDYRTRYAHLPSWAIRFGMCAPM